MVVVRASSAKPTALPTNKPSQAPPALPTVYVPASGALSSLVLILLLVAGVLVLIQVGYLLMRRRRRNIQAAKINPDPKASLDPPADVDEWETAAATAHAEALRTHVSLVKERASLGNFRAELTNLEEKGLAQEQTWWAEQANRAGTESLSKVEEDRALAQERSRIAERSHLLEVRRNVVKAASTVKILEAEHAKWTAELAQKGLPQPAMDLPPTLEPANPGRHKGKEQRFSRLIRRQGGWPNRRCKP